MIRLECGDGAANLSGHVRIYGERVEWCVLSKGNEAV